MNFKNKWKRFWTLERHANHGFTLVELIVVIAILGILAGAGTAGYAGYVKSAKKKADQTLVSNIVRAIEVGTNSTMFVNGDSFKMGQLSYPIGFITLTADATTDSHVVTSSTEVYPATEGNCDFVRVDGIVTVTTVTDYEVCNNHKNCERTTVSSPNAIYYCREHGPEAVITELTGTYTSGYNHTAGTWGFGWSGCTGSNSCGSFSPIETPYDEGAKTISNLDALYQPSANNSSLCEAAYANQYKTFGTPEVGNATVGDTLYDAITAAFGSVEGLKLQYDGWTSEEGLGYASLYTYAPTMFDEIKLLADDLADYSTGWGTSNYIAGEYADGEEVMTDFSAAFADVYSGEAGLALWLERWDNHSGAPYSGSGHGFGFDSYNGAQYREYYSAVRKAYNSAFASYLSSCGINDTYVAVVSGYSVSLLGIDGVSEFPAVANTDAFTNSESGLNAKFYAAGDKTDTDGDGLYDNFEKCAELFETYKTSEVCGANAKAFYDTILTIHETADVAQSDANASNGDMFSYYKNYMNEMASLYDAAQDAAGDGIVIIVSVENGEVKCNVSPSAADLRNAD